MKKVPTINKNDVHQYGFTLIELLVVFATMSVLAITGMAAFVTFTNAQTLTSAALDVKSMMELAKSQSLTQAVANKCSVGQQFNGYKVLICCTNGGSGCPTCGLAKDYEIDIVCGSSSIAISGKNLPKGVSVDINTANTTSRSYLFSPLSGTIVGAGQVTLDGFGKSRVITVTSTGVIQ